jgi:hypothetical protein
MDKHPAIEELLEVVAYIRDDTMYREEPMITELVLEIFQGAHQSTICTQVSTIHLSTII